MRRALIGYTGFVGSNLDRQQAFTDRYNSQNFREMAGQRFDEVICAGVQAVKWWANQNPTEDWAGIAPLLDILGQAEIKRLVLISTVDVYKRPIGVDENTPIETDGLHAYGLHRWQVEEWVRANVADHMIVRLPGLFGEGLKKNLIFDLLTGKPVDGFDERSSFQFYHLDRLSRDLETAAGAGLRTVNFAVPPVTVADVAERVTGAPYANRTENPPMHYDMQTIHGSVWGEAGAYLESAESCLSGIAAFAENWRREHAA
jgi:nucleoside-diphosphate-sugar epimerase